MASSSASTFASPTTDLDNIYDVFINCHSPDVKKFFAPHLYRSLLSRGLRVFLDTRIESLLSPGHNICFQIEGAIRTASIHVAIFSPGYAESARNLNELLLMLASNAPIVPVFYNVTPAQLRWTRGDGVYAQALRNLEEKKVYDPQTPETKLRYESNTIENWRKALSAVADISGFELEAFDGDEGKLVHKVVERVLRKVKKPALHVAEYPIGLAEKVNDFEKKVLLRQSGKPSVAGIFGLGGVGKTTLAKELFNRTRSQYSRSCFVFDVRENARGDRLTSLQKKLLRELTGLDLQIDNIDEGKDILKQHLSFLSAFIVLDDVDHQDQVEALLLDKAILRSDSLILITTRDKGVLSSSGVENESIYQLIGLNEIQSRELFCSHAFGQPYPFPGFESMVDDFLEACGGLPLSLKVLGALLCGENDLHYWEKQLDKLQHSLPNDIQETSNELQLTLFRGSTYLPRYCLFLHRRRQGQGHKDMGRVWLEWSSELSKSTKQVSCRGRQRKLHKNARSPERHGQRFGRARA